MMVQVKVCRINLNIRHFFYYFLNIISKPLCRVIELHIGKMRPFLFITSLVPSLGPPKPLKRSKYDIRFSYLHSLITTPRPKRSCFVQPIGGIDELLQFYEFEVPSGKNVHYFYQIELLQKRLRSSIV